MNADESLTRKTHGGYDDRKRGLDGLKLPTWATWQRLERAYGEPLWEHLLVKTDLDVDCSSLHAARYANTSKSTTRTRTNAGQY